MKEFIEKLIGRLEEISVENTCSDCPYKAKCDEVQEHINDETTDLCGATIKALSIEIVNQLAEEYKPKTQADKIRAMNDEELAEFLYGLDHYWDDGQCILRINDNHLNDYKDDILDWLQSEAETKGE